MSKILVLAETFEDKLRKSSLSAITFAKKLGGAFDIAVLGSGIGAVGQELAGYGAGAVYVVDNPGFANYVAGPWTKAVVKLAETAGADIVTATGSTFSRDLLPRVAARLNAGMVSEVVGIGDAPNTFKREMWAGNVLGTVKVNTAKVVLTVRGTEFAQATASDGASSVNTSSIAFEDDGKAKFVKFTPTVSERPDLAEASVVISGGRGLKDKAGFDSLLNPLADLFSGAIGATRAVVDAGYAPNDLQVGQTGKVVAPTLYIAIGLSGAIQHVAGMKNSKVIVAINKDAEAPIFSIADYGLVADAFKAVPELIDELKKVKGA